MKKIAILVDACSTGAKLPSEFAKHDIDCIHVQSSLNIGPDFLATFSKDNFVEKFVVSEALPLAQIAHALEKYRPICVIPGAETGVEVAEQLSDLLRLSGNKSTTSHLRRDKHCMHEQLKSLGLSRLRQIRCRNVKEALEWARSISIWPLVLKPTASAGADGVTFCHNLSDVEQAALTILGKKNKLGGLNDAIVLQERITGQQFIMNAVSINGQHYVSEIWRDDKIPVDGASMICDREVLLLPDLPISKEIQDYVKRCLDALGVTDGPSHSELFRTDEGELILIETAARMQGTIDHEAVIEATGHSHVTLTALRYANPDKFFELIGTGYRRKIHLHCVTLCSQQEGTVYRNHCAERLGNLASFRSLIHTPNEGDVITRTIDLFTNPGIVYLGNQDEAILEQEYKQIREWERAGVLFSIM